MIALLMLNVLVLLFALFFYVEYKSQEDDFTRHYALHWWGVCKWCMFYVFIIDIVVAGVVIL